MPAQIGRTGCLLCRGWKTFLVVHCGAYACEPGKHGGVMGDIMGRARNRHGRELDQVVPKL